MQQSLNRFSKKKSSYTPVAKSQRISAQHVSANTVHTSNALSKEFRTILHSIPWETLCHVTSYLDPVSLARLSQVDKYLKKIINDDLIWNFAFAFHYLGIDPERTRSSPKGFLLRRIETTWKREYILRDMILRRWQKSRTTITSHTPLRFPGSIHMLSDKESILTSSSDHSIITRSVIAKGKVPKGQFHPNHSDMAHPVPIWVAASTSAVASEGGTAKIAWGTFTGELLVKVAPRVMENHPRAAKSTRSLAVDQHQGNINHISWAASKSIECEYVATASEDGVAKVWDINSCTPVWSSPLIDKASPCIHVAFDLSRRTAITILKNRRVTFWSSIGLLPDDPSTASRIDTVIPIFDVDDPPTLDTSEVSMLLDCSLSQVSVVIHIEGQSHFWMIQVSKSGEHLIVKRLTGAIGAISAFHLDNSSLSSEAPFLLAGNSLGEAHIWELTSSDSDSDIPSALRWTADESRITAVQTNRIVVATGSTSGIINIWNAITLGLVRTINATSLGRNGVGVVQIILDVDSLAAIIGRSISYWKAGSQERSKAKRMHSGGSRRMNSGVRKYNQSDIVHAIKESQAQLEARSGQSRQAATSAQEQMEALQALGLDEAGAVEYMLMLSHDEAAKDQNPLGTTERSAHNAEENACIPQDSDSQTGSPFSTPRSFSSSSPSLRREEFMPSSPWKSNSISKVSPPASSGKIQVSPPYRPETLQIGGSTGAHASWAGYGSPLNKNTRSKSATSGSEKDLSNRDKKDFPKISHSSGTADIANSDLAPKTTTSVIVAKKAGSWSTVVKNSASSGRYSSIRNLPPDLPANIAQYDEDAQLQFALELSLAEAKSRTN